MHLLYLVSNHRGGRTEHRRCYHPAGEVQPYSVQLDRRRLMHEFERVCCLEQNSLCIRRSV